MSMIGQIGYLGQVSPRTGISSALMYTLGATLGATAIGGALGFLGMGLRWLFGFGYASNTVWVLLLVAGIALICGLRDLGFVSLRLPQPRKQVRRSWLEVYGPHRAGLYWGLGVGLAYSTGIHSLY